MKTLVIRYRVLGYPHTDLVLGCGEATSIDRFKGAWGVIAKFWRYAPTLVGWSEEP